MAKEKRSFFQKLKDGLANTREGMVGRIESVVSGRKEFDESMLEDLEEALILSDIDMDTTEKIIQELRQDISRLSIRTEDKLMQQIRNIIAYFLTSETGNELKEDLPLVILMVGVNGTGKTTSMAKIAHRLQQEGKTVMFAAADTFRAAAAEQLQIWGDRVSVPRKRGGSMS